jgi:N-acetylglucosamine kinase-like BadF-type ATPase
MILIADSGSTKCSWAICDLKGNIVDRCSTIGFNPYFITSKKVLNHLDESALNEIRHQITKVFFYGAGCSSKKMNAIIEKPFKFFFSKADVNIHHDLDAACYSMYDGKPAITGILGTGSNSCYFDGDKIYESAPSLGFMLGDEASGNSFGKKIINLYFNNILSDDLKVKYEKEYEKDISVINTNVYNNPKANVYLAKFFPFVSDNKDHIQMKTLILSSIEEFFQLHISCFENYQKVKINFIGSVAFFLEQEIVEVAKKSGCQIGYIVKNPIDKLIEYHFKK